MYTLLIADDEANERALIRFLLRDFHKDLIILEARNGKEALTAIQKKHVDILLSDIQMPFLNGIELATETKKDFPDIEILFFSGHDDFTYVQNALSLKAVNYILKPVNPAEFHKALTDIIKRLDSRIIEFSKSEQYIESSFHERCTDLAGTDSADSSGSSEEDTLLLQNINLAIKLKQPEQLTSLVHELLNKYASATKISHIYIRYTCTSLLKVLMSSCVTLGESEFEESAKKIYSFQHFYDISHLLETYLDKAVSLMNQNPEETNYAVSLVKQYINQHYREDLSLDALAELVYLSPNYLSNIFTKTAGESINKYIRQIRIQRAQELLLHTNMKIADISIQVGYPNPSYFCKIFQNQFGTTPERFRNPSSGKEGSCE